VVFKLEAQNYSSNNYYNIGYQQSFGAIIKHSSNFIPKVNGITSFYEGTYTSRFLKPKAWKVHHHFPELKISALYARYANRQVFGDSYNALIGLNYIKAHNKWKRNFSYQFGINYSSKPYNKVTNPTNNIIGSKLNLTLKLAYGLEYFINQNLSVGLNAVLMHHSNGSAQTPNLGINVAAVGVELKWYQQRKPFSINDLTDSQLKKPHQFGVAVAYARQERVKPFNGPKYAVYGLQLFGLKRLSNLWQFNYGLNFDYRTTLAQAYKNYDSYGRNLFFKVMRWQPFIGAELLYGNFGLSASVGFYPVSNNAISTRIPTTIGANYYFKNLDKVPDNNVRLSLVLKTHFSVAEYIAFMVGYVF